MRRIILLTGTGKGKTLLATLLEQHYLSLGVPCRRLVGLELSPEHTKDLIRECDQGYVILDADPAGITRSAELTPWQTIIFHGGSHTEPTEGLNRGRIAPVVPFCPTAPSNTQSGGMGCSGLGNGLCGGSVGAA